MPDKDKGSTRTRGRSNEGDRDDLAEAISWQGEPSNELPNILGGGWLTCNREPFDDDYFPDLEDDEPFGISKELIRRSADAAYVHAFAPAFSAIDELLEHMHELCIDEELILCRIYAYQKRRAVRLPAERRDAVLEPLFGVDDKDERQFEDRMSAVTESLIALERARCCDGDVDAHPAELLEVQLSVRALASYASGVGANLDPYLVQESVVELREAYHILESVAREACIGGRRNAGAFGLIAKYSGTEGGDVAVARRVQGGVNARKALIHLTGDDPLDGGGLKTFTEYVYGWAAANAKLREDGLQPPNARDPRARAGQDAAKQKIYLLPQRLSW